MEKCFLKAVLHYQGPLQEDTHDVFIDIGSISVIQPSSNGLKIKLANSAGTYYVKDFHRYRFDDVFDLYKRNVQAQDGNIHGRGGFVL